MRIPTFCLAALTLTSCTTVPQREVTYRAAQDQMRDGRKELVFATYNLHGLRDPEGLRQTLRELKSVDVWAFQEVNAPIGSPHSLFSETMPPKALLEILPEGKWNIYFVPLNPIGKNPTEVEGLAIASKIPLSDKQIWRLRASRDGDPKGKRRAAQAAKVTIHGQSILVVNTDHEVHWLKIRSSDRQLQVDDLLENLGTGKSEANMPVVLMGDFNCSGRPLNPFGMTADTEVRMLRTSLGTVGLERLPGNKQSIDTFRSFLWSHPIDHIFTRGLDCSQWGTTKGYVGSDHRPLWAELR